MAEWFAAFSVGPKPLLTGLLESFMLAASDASLPSFYRLSCHLYLSILCTQRPTSDAPRRLIFEGFVFCHVVSCDSDTMIVIVIYYNI